MVDEGDILIDFYEVGTHEILVEATASFSPYIVEEITPDLYSATENTSERKHYTHHKRVDAVAIYSNRRPLYCSIAEIDECDGPPF